MLVLYSWEQAPYKRNPTAYRRRVKSRYTRQGAPPVALGSDVDGGDIGSGDGGGGG